MMNQVTSTHLSHWIVSNKLIKVINLNLLNKLNLRNRLKLKRSSKNPTRHPPSKSSKSLSRRMPTKKKNPTSILISSTKELCSVTWQYSINKNSNHTMKNSLSKRTQSFQSKNFSSSLLKTCNLVSLNLWIQSNKFRSILEYLNKLFSPIATQSKTVFLDRLSLNTH